VSGKGDVSSIAMGGGQRPWRALARYGETVIESAGTGMSEAFFPTQLDRIVTGCSGQIWAGNSGTYVSIVALMPGQDHDVSSRNR
ncbi:MAG: hypothetical protein KDA78_21285, partial [Planctomycetaceae bacterium]|nr:hypothetical protein [Planctomycetaceae bacterium]